MTLILTLFVLSVPAIASNGSHSLRMFVTCIKGQTPFPELSAIVMLDDITVGYLDSNTKIYIPRGNTTDESDVFKLKDVKEMYNFMLESSERRSVIDGNISGHEGLRVYQKFAQCELLDNGEPGLMITRDAAKGNTTDEVHLLGDNFTYTYRPEQYLKEHLKDSEDRHRNLYYPTCISLLKNYLNTRTVKPTVKMIQKTYSASGGSRVSCLGTGFYPRHINLTLFRDGQSVSDHEITGGDLLPNDDGTYQMRKSLEISAEEEREKHKYICSVTHISLDNKLDVTLINTFDAQQLAVIGAAAGVAIVVLLCVIILGVMKIRDSRSSRQTDLSNNDYNSVPISLGNLIKETSNINADESTT